MRLMNPPGGLPWALYALCGTSLVLNLVLGLQLANTSDIEVTVASADERLAVADPALGSDPVSPEQAVVAQQAASIERALESTPEGMEAVSATVRHSLARTFQDTVPTDRADVVAAVYARLFFWKLDVRRDLQPGDELKALYEWDGKLAHIPAATYFSQKNGTLFAAFQYKASTDTYASWWDEDGNEVSYRLNDGPLADYQQVTALVKDRPRHRGMDFKTPVGTQVYSPRSGKISRVNWNLANNGNCVEVRYRDGAVARFLHLSATDVRAGQSVRKGQVLGETGNTGHSTAPHLHYELEKGGEIIDPIDYHGVVQRTLPASDRADFRRVVSKFKRWLEAAS
jgi:murein DD-endopeptidase MepM/ murein hydrolase activator NlpD